MLRKLFFLVSFVLVLGLVGNVSADIQFPDTSGDHLWNTPANWATGALPTLNDGYVRLFTLPGPIIMAGESYVVNGIHLGNTGDVAGALTLKGGSLEVLGALNCGFKGPGTINMIDGTLLIPGTLKIARDPGSLGHINLNGGTVTANSFLMRENEDAVGTLNVGGGMLTVNGDQISLLQEYIDNGWITTYEGSGTPNMDYNVSNPGQTTLTAVHNLTPVPANRSIVRPGQVELIWTLPDSLNPGDPVSVDVYFTDDLQALEQFTDPAAIQVVNKQNATSVTVQTQAKTRYFWAVDTYIDSASDFPVVGPIFSFLADNAPPSVNAGPDINTFLQDDGTRTGPLNGAVTDDGAVQPYTVTWSVLEQPSDADPDLPAAVIADPAAEQTTVTVAAEGTYVLQLEADDGEYTSSDTVTINVIPDDWTQ
ncbi:MAG: hypothetical protein RQ760_17605 [Sedimentisphaerales bacterium]|nr:hypothetical protein [Sedimentisphaerales bacterium]